MDALEFLKERKRMCSLHKACGECPLRGAKCALSISTSDENYKRAIATVEQWSKNHPDKTRQSVFLEQWSDAVLDRFGVIQLCPMDVSAAHRGNNGKCKHPEKMCIDCRRGVGEGDEEKEVKLWLNTLSANHYWSVQNTTIIIASLSLRKQ